MEQTRVKPLVLSCHCHVLGACRGRTPLLLEAKPQPNKWLHIKQGKIICFPLIHRKRKLFQGAHSQRQTIHCLCLLAAGQCRGAAREQQDLGQPWHPHCCWAGISHPAIPHVLSLPSRMLWMSWSRSAGRWHILEPGTQRALWGNLLKVQHFWANAHSWLSLEQGFQYNCGQNLLQRKLGLFIFWRQIWALSILFSILTLTKHAFSKAC